MAAYTIIVEAYPASGATNLEVQEYTKWGWEQVLDTASVGTYPAYTTSYSVTATSSSKRFRCRWTVDGSDTDWFAPESIHAAPTADEAARLRQAIIAKAIRFLVLPEAPFGAFGEASEFGATRIAVRPDSAIRELLYGFRYKGLVLSGITITTAEVIRAGMGIAESDFDASKLPDVEKAIDAATNWVEAYLAGAGIG